MPIIRNKGEVLEPVGHEDLDANWTRAITGGNTETIEKPAKEVAEAETLWFITFMRRIAQFSKGIYNSILGKPNR